MYIVINEILLLMKMSSLSFDNRNIIYTNNDESNFQLKKEIFLCFNFSITLLLVFDI